MHPVQVCLGNTFGFETLPHFGNFTLAADHTNVACLTVVDLFQNLLVVLMPARDQNDVIVLTEIKRPPDVVKIHHDSCVRLGKTFCIGKGRPVINHFCFKAGELRSPYQEKGDVATAKDIDRRRRQYGLQKDLQLDTVRGLTDTLAEWGVLPA